MSAKTYRQLAELSEKRYEETVAQTRSAYLWWSLIMQKYESALTATIKALSFSNNRSLTKAEWFAQSPYPIVRWYGRKWVRETETEVTSKVQRDCASATRTAKKLQLMVMMAHPKKYTPEEIGYRLGIRRETLEALVKELDEEMQSIPESAKQSIIANTDTDYRQPQNEEAK